MAKNKAQQKPAKEAKILKLSAAYTKEEREDLEQYKAKAIELENRLHEHLKAGMDEFNNWLREQGFRLEASAPISEILPILNQALNNPNIKDFAIPVGIAPLPPEQEEE